ncbi:hypothetical protein [Nocardia vermiculata]|uniref:Secreted protein n=1 Tax=Nocardia vermiculata TaxID=257274 RepID=A0A846XW27_9NOCA|nr:hypothetical protein [Nocardia vermiculata]NKY49591.1 hypothetical protein [Nocardia vermiculata]
MHTRSLSRLVCIAAAVIAAGSAAAGAAGAIDTGSAGFGAPGAQPAVHAGDDCTAPDAVTTDPDGRTLYCNPTVNGRWAGNLVWQLLP